MQKGPLQGGGDQPRMPLSSFFQGTMETLTRVMARTVYGIDLNDPPLKQLTHRRRVKELGKMPRNTHQYASEGVLRGEHSRRSLSSGWTSFNQVSKLLVWTPLGKYPFRF